MLEKQNGNRLPLVVYVDNNPEIMLARYLNDKAISDGTFSFASVIYKPESGYKSLLENDLIKKADVLLLDNRLFEERDGYPRLEGVEIRVFFNLIFPYKKILIVTQYDDEDFNNLDYIVHKYSDAPGRDNSESSIFEFYDFQLREKLCNSILDIKYTWSLIEKIKESDIFKTDKVLIEDMIDVANNTVPHYGRLTSEDINKFVEVIKSIRC